MDKIVEKDCYDLKKVISYESDIVIPVKVSKRDEYDCV